MMSLIVTGCSAWTIYEGNDYSGYAMCVFPSDSTACLPGLYPTAHTLSTLGGKVSSVRKGCLAQTRVYPSNWAGNTTRSASPASSGFFNINN